MGKQLRIKSIILNQKCSKCDNWAAKIEIVEPHGYPIAALQWSPVELRRYRKYRDFKSYYLIYSGPGGSSGSIGTPINDTKKSALIDAFTEPLDAVKIKAQFYDMAGYCADCRLFYCSVHWNSGASGYGECPKGHKKSLDPHWSPDY